jgi:ribosomal protein L40E
MSTLKFTLPLSLSLHPRHRHARKGPRPSTPDEQSAAPTRGAGSQEQVSHILRRLKKSIRRGFISEIDMALSFSLDVLRDGDDEAPTDLLIEAPTIQGQVCSACDAANDTAAKFCNQCGTAFTPTPPNHPTVAPGGE